MSAGKCSPNSQLDDVACVIELCRKNTSFAMRRSGDVMDLFILLLHHLPRNEGGLEPGLCGNVVYYSREFSTPCQFLCYHLSVSRAGITATVRNKAIEIILLCLAGSVAVLFLMAGQQHPSFRSDPWILAALRCFVDGGGFNGFSIPHWQTENRGLQSGCLPLPPWSFSPTERQA